LLLLNLVIVGALRPTFVGRSSLTSLQSPLFVRVSNLHATEPGVCLHASDEKQTEDASTEPSLGTKVDILKHKVRTRTDKLAQVLNEFGQEQKPKAKEYREKAQDPDLKALKQYKFVVLSWLCYSAFIGYRAFRGFFVILPAVFQETFHKMEEAIDYAPLADLPNASVVGVDDAVSIEDVDPKTGKVRLRTKATVFVLTAIVMCTYVVGGLMRVVGKFLKRMANKPSAYSAFEAAAEEMLSNEEKMMKLSSKNPSAVNGDSGLAP